MWASVNSILSKSKWYLLPTLTYLRKRLLDFMNVIGLTAYLHKLVSFLFLVFTAYLHGIIWPGLHQSLFTSRAICVFPSLWLSAGSFVFHRSFLLTAAYVLLSIASVDLGMPAANWVFLCWLLSPRFRFTKISAIIGYFMCLSPAISLHSILAPAWSSHHEFCLSILIFPLPRVYLHDCVSVTGFTSVLFCMGFTASYSLHRLSFSVWSTLTGFGNLLWLVHKSSSSWICW